ncbi:hypothetical protein J21TS3_25030 [Paenibacillus cookii]|uniref:Uncharacterized protein n=1 Tax=Paenibacillus cookii TaxID=157839 RepID=A0ABQ4LWR2_9BACL|nr:hypothetical protein CM49_00779 [Paenibacillus sp. P1XP2]GIO67682.1 hypothetical protein J21TS3_25030 [Paenibacillus cookii]
MWVPGLLARYEPDSILYFLIANGPERRDADFSLRKLTGLALLFERIEPSRIAEETERLRQADIRSENASNNNHFNAL